MDIPRHTGLHGVQRLSVVYTEVLPFPYWPVIASAVALANQIAERDQPEGQDDERGGFENLGGHVSPSQLSRFVLLSTAGATIFYSLSHHQ